MTQAEIIAAFRALNKQSRDLFQAGNAEASQNAYVQAQALFGQIEDNTAFEDEWAYTNDIEGKSAGETAEDQKAAQGDYTAGKVKLATAEANQPSGWDTFVGDIGFDPDPVAFASDVRKTIGDPTSGFNQLVGYMKTLGIVGAVVAALALGVVVYSKVK